ncbi:WD40 repeat protein [Giardia muris]|uniref:Cilia- and flagella-associated protein 52 n=1 Tax=Giardia muris TaxID=5742 RepID=A0A4Z1SUG7_GIAMU|nr:WD40 repeat protein [Giardia muris]|eukprot:TNJ29506.1 WD40 repeat protein [Giardia muris]
MSLQLRRVLGFNPNRPHTLLFHPDGERCIYSAGRTIIISSLTDPENQTILRGHVAPISYLALDPTSNTLISAEEGDDSDVCLWDLEEESLKFRFSEHDFGVASATYSADGLFYASYGAADKTVFVSEAASFDIVCRRRLNDFELTTLVFGARICDERGRRLALYNLVGLTTTGSAVAFTFDPESSTLSHTVLGTGGRKIASDVAHCLRDRSLLVAGTTTSELLVIDAIRNTLLSTTVLPHGTPIDCITILPHAATSQARPVYSTYESYEMFNETIVAGGHGFITIVKGQGTNWTVLATLTIPGQVTNLAADKDGRILAGINTGLILLISPDADTYTSVPVSENHTKPVTSACFIGDGAEGILVSVAKDCTVRIWDLQNFFPGLTIYTTPSVPSITCINDIQILVGCTDGNLLIYDIETGDKLATIDGADRIGLTALYGQRTKILTGGSHGDVREWDLRSRKMVTNHKEHTLAVTALFPTKDGAIVSASEDRFIIASRGGIRVADYQAEGPIRDMTMLGDICAIASGRSLALVDVPKRKLVGKLELGVRMTAVTHNTRYIFAGSETGTLYILTHALELVEEIPAHAVDSNLHSLVCSEQWLCTMDDDGCALVWSIL